MARSRRKAASASATAATKTDQGLARANHRKRTPAPKAAPPTLNQIRYPCLMNMDYHAAREGWLDQIHRWLMFIVIVGGAGALLDAWAPMKIIGPVVAVLAGALDLTFDLSNRARAHAMFRRRYSEILSDASRDADRLADLQCRLDQISGEEEPPFNAQLMLSAMKAQQQTYAKITDPCRPRLVYRILANLLRFEGHDFNERAC